MPERHPQAPPASPCVDICLLDDDDICVGCYRSAREITAWSQLDAEEKRAVIARSQERRRRGGGLF
jgi:predicted Fe-S protein YdhL (DUF1289 family)